jgi:hypothetical protein
LFTFFQKNTLAGLGSGKGYVHRLQQAMKISGMAEEIVNNEKKLRANSFLLWKFHP